MSSEDDWPALRLWALRGAITVDRNDAAEIRERTEELVSELLERNSLEPDRLVSCIFTCTDDLDAEFPAAAARDIGLESVPLLCTREIAVPGSLPRVIRVMVHAYAPQDFEPQHIYLRDAVALRADIASAQ